MVLCVMAFFLCMTQLSVLRHRWSYERATPALEKLLDRTCGAGTNTEAPSFQHCKPDRGPLGRMSKVRESLEIKQKEARPDMKKVLRYTNEAPWEETTAAPFERMLEQLMRCARLSTSDIDTPLDEKYVCFELRWMNNHCRNQQEWATTMKPGRSDAVHTMYIKPLNSHRNSGLPKYFHVGQPELLNFCG